MPKLKLTDSVALKAAGPTGSANQALYTDTESPLGLRVTKNAKTWFCEVWARPTVAGGKGKQIRRSLGGINELSCAEARRLAFKVAGELLDGKDRLEEAREEKAKVTQDAVTLAAAVAEYVKGKRRGKDGLALKPRTVNDYLAIVNSGVLSPLAEKSIYQITAAEIRSTYEAAAKRSQRQATYGMQVLRACLNWHGISVDDNPLDKATAGRGRIVLPATKGDPKPIPPEKLDEWWGEASKLAGQPAADGLRFMLLTGCRPGEVFGSKVSKQMMTPGLLVRDVDMEGGRVTLADTKNRTTHTVYLSTQALEILKPHMKDKEPTDRVFAVLDPGKTLDNINAAAGVAGITSHKLRHTFASVAEELVSGYALKKMMNHAGSGDVTGSHYIGKGATQLRAAWQVVADFVTGDSSVVPLRRVA